MEDIVHESLFSAAQKASAAMLELTAGDREQSVALRALTLHMLEGHAPGAFARLGLAAELERSVQKAAGVPHPIEPGLTPAVAQARIDAWYLRRLRGLPHPAPDAEVLRAYLEKIFYRGDELYAWLLGELAAQTGIDVRIPFGDHQFDDDAVMYLFFLTHRVLLESRYLARPVTGPAWDPVRSELQDSVAWLLVEKRIDLAAEVAFALQCLGNGQAASPLIGLFLGHQRPDGSVFDRTIEADDDDALAMDHTTAGSLLALAGAIEPGR